MAILEDCCMAFANKQVSELWPMGTLSKVGQALLSTSSCIKTLKCLSFRVTDDSGKLRD